MSLEIFCDECGKCLRELCVHSPVHLWFKPVTDSSRHFVHTWMPDNYIMINKTGENYGFPTDFWNWLNR